MAEDAKSLSCDICGVRLRNAVAAQVHAEKTDHQSFSESTEEIKRNPSSTSLDVIDTQ